MSRTFRAAFVTGALVLGVLGVEPAAGQSVRPPVAEAGGSDWRTVDTGIVHTCGIKANGRLFCWGSDGHGQLGNIGTNATSSIPIQVAGGRSDWVQVSAGGYHTCARRSTGRLYCWGSDSAGQLGDGGTNTDQPTPIEVAGGRTDWVQVSAGASHTCARRSSGRLYCWGNDNVGQLGDGGIIASRSTPVEVAGRATNWTQVGSGDAHTCARRSTGRLFCWGYDAHGQLGDGGTNTDQPTPVEVAGGATTWGQVSAGGRHTCARRSTGRLYCWGSDAQGRLGNGGPDTDRDVPVPVAAGDIIWTQVDASDFSHTCARSSTGRVYCWGADDAGQLGDGGSNTSYPYPREVDGRATDWTAVSAGGRHVCARITSGRLFCWGSDEYGQLGDGGPNTSWPTPIQVSAPPL